VKKKKKKPRKIYTDENGMKYREVIYMVKGEIVTKEVYERT
jgi:hypothetical protein